MKENVKEILEGLSWDETFSREEIEERIRSTIAEELEGLKKKYAGNLNPGINVALQEAQELIHKRK